MSEFLPLFAVHCTTFFVNFQSGINESVSSMRLNVQRMTTSPVLSMSTHSLTKFLYQDQSWMWVQFSWPDPTRPVV